jgi:hypothetical protein
VVYNEIKSNICERQVFVQVRSLHSVIV